MLTFSELFQLFTHFLEFGKVVHWSLCVSYFQIEIPRAHIFFITLLSIIPYFLVQMWDGGLNTTPRLTLPTD